MSVTLRCPSCGTTRDAPGECDACHDAEVRYFCDDHVPGAWLNGRTCERCGASFGERPHERVIPTPVAPRARPTARTIRPPAPDVAVRVRYAPEIERAVPPGLNRAQTVVGCLLRLAFIALLLFVALLVAVFFLARSLLPGLLSTSESSSTETGWSSRLSVPFALRLIRLPTDAGCGVRYSAGAGDALLVGKRTLK